MSITPEQLDEIEKLAEAATPGPWVWRGPDEPADLWTADGKDPIVCVQTTNADIKFIRAMREHALPLVKALREAWSDRDDAQAEIERVRQLCKERTRARDEARDEVERLRSALRLLFEEAQDKCAIRDATFDAVERALKEGDR